MTRAAALTGTGALTTTQSLNLLGKGTVYRALSGAWQRVAAVTRL